MQHQSTPVKRPLSSNEETSNEVSTFIMRPSQGGRRISGPVKPIPEERQAPSEITGAPTACRSRQVAELHNTIVAATIPSDAQTPRRRSTQLVNVQKTPTKTSTRRHSAAAAQESEAPKAFAPLRAHREETRELARTHDIMPLPCF